MNTVLRVAKIVLIVLLSFLVVVGILNYYSPITEDEITPFPKLIYSNNEEYYIYDVSLHNLRIISENGETIGDFNFNMNESIELLKVEDDSIWIYKHKANEVLILKTSGELVSENVIDYDYLISTIDYLVNQDGVFLQRTLLGYQINDNGNIIQFYNSIDYLVRNTMIIVLALFYFVFLSSEIFIERDNYLLINPKRVRKNLTDDEIFNVSVHSKFYYYRRVESSDLKGKIEAYKLKVDYIKQYQKLVLCLAISNLILTIIWLPFILVMFFVHFIILMQGHRIELFILCKKIKQGVL